MKFSRRRKARLDSFTLVELLVVVAIIALLANLLFPIYKTAILRAQGLKCAANLRAIGTAVSLAVSDNHNVYPEIDQAAAPIYSPPGQGLVTVLSPYGVTTNTVQCPVDQALGVNASCSNMSYPNPGSSYQWTPIFDDESLNSPVVYVTPTRGIPINNARVHLCSDFQRIHHGWYNVLWGDGHVSTH